MIQTLTMTRPDDWHLHLRDAVPFGVDTLVPLRAGEQVEWRLEETRR